MSIWQIYNLELAYFLCYWANCHCCKWPNIEKVIWSHCCCCCSGCCCCCRRRRHSEWDFYVKLFVNMSKRFLGTKHISRLTALAFKLSFSSSLLPLEWLPAVPHRRLLRSLRDTSRITTSGISFFSTPSPSSLSCLFAFYMLSLFFIIPLRTNRPTKKKKKLQKQKKISQLTVRVGSSVIPRVDSYKYLITNYGNERKKALFSVLSDCVFLFIRKWLLAQLLLRATHLISADLLYSTWGISKTSVYCVSASWITKVGMKLFWKKGPRRGRHERTGRMKCYGICAQSFKEGGDELRRMRAPYCHTFIHPLLWLSSVYIRSL